MNRQTGLGPLSSCLRDPRYLRSVYFPSNRSKITRLTQMLAPGWKASLPRWPWRASRPWSWTWCRQRPPQPPARASRHGGLTSHKSPRSFVGRYVCPRFLYHDAGTFIDILCMYKNMSIYIQIDMTICTCVVRTDHQACSASRAEAVQA